ncbi:transposase [Clostridium sp. USBA 49]|jgi:transposase-like protein|uniref:transposase n=2 Tax=Clostridium TaxID=1485 RepID=UPI0011773F6E|nr:transposase [Clostridium sp. USBA 49]
MAKGQKYYTEEFRKTIVELYNSGKSLAELSSEYGCFLHNTVELPLRFSLSSLLENLL